MKEVYEKVSSNLGFVEREKATRRFWEENGIVFNDENSEVLICGSGDGKLSGTGLMRETEEVLNQRFLIHILPKPGKIGDNGL